MHSRIIQNKYTINEILVNNGTLVNNGILVDEILGKGKFGNVYKGKRIKDQESVAIKIESSKEYKTLKHETTILNYLHNHGAKQIPTVFWYGIFEKCPTLIMTYYQNSLEDYIKHKSISQEKLDTIMNLLLGILENVHQHYVIHRDIKPQNIMMKDGELFLIDFGMSTFYVDENFKHVECRRDKEYIIGTPKYISYHIHDGYEPSRRDDLISLGYLYLHILGKRLPWENIQLHSNQEIRAPINQERKRLKSIDCVKDYMKTMISETISESISESIREPINESIHETKIYKYIETCYNLRFDETPNYNI